MLFSKYEGTGNDFILIDDRTNRFSFDEKKIAHLCHRKFGIGADGLILLQSDKEGSFEMRIFNSNGKEAESCGNGLRCLGQFLLDLGFPKQSYAIKTHDRQVKISYLKEGVGVLMGKAQDLKLKIATEMGEVHFANTGVPHAVHFVKDVEKVNLHSLGPLLRHHSLFQPKGVNVNVAALQADQTIHVRTFERGVEGETLACGTGACAVAAIASELYCLPFPIHICFAGGKLKILLEEEGLLMVGSAHKVFDGIAL